VPARIRQALSVESGLNDGLSVPFLALFLAIAADQTVPEARDWLGFAAAQIGLGTLIGAGVGGGGTWLGERSSERGLTTPLFEQFGDALHLRRSPGFDSHQATWRQTSGAADTSCAKTKSATTTSVVISHQGPALASMR
jgi:hypothetical protein